MKNRIINYGVALLLTVCLCGCGSHKSVEEQVAENLLGQGETTIEWESVPETTEEQPEENIATPIEEKEETVPEIAEDEPVINAEASTEEEVAEPIPEEDDDRIQIVFMGDSIFDNARDGSGVPYLVGEACDANIYNLAIGGTTAALYHDEQAEHNLCRSIGMMGMVYAACGFNDGSQFEGFYAKKVLDKVDFSKTDYFVLEYGTNDFISVIPISTFEENDPFGYYGAIQAAVQTLLENFPNAQVIFCTPHYEEFYNRDGKWMGDINSFNRGYGPLSAYIGAAENAARSSGAYVINSYNDIDINSYTADDDLEDGIHLTEQGRKKYADVVSHVIQKLEEEKQN